VMDSESNGIRHFFGNPKSDGYLKSDHDGFTDLDIFVSVHVYNILVNQKQQYINWWRSVVLSLLFWKQLQ